MLTGHFSSQKGECGRMTALHKNRFLCLQVMLVTWSWHRRLATEMSCQSFYIEAKFQPNTDLCLPLWPLPLLCSSQLLVLLLPSASAWIHEHAQWQPHVVLGDGERSTGTTGITRAGRSADAGFLQSVRSALWGKIRSFLQHLKWQLTPGSKIHIFLLALVLLISLDLLVWVDEC